MSKKKGIVDCDIVKYENDKIDDIKEKEKFKQEYSKIGNEKKEVSSNTSKEEKINKKELTKSLRLLYQYAECNASEFKTFITLTFKENISDIEKANKKFNSFITNIRGVLSKNGKELKYLGVPEYQKRGAVHYHIMTNIDYNDNDIIVPQKDKPKYMKIQQWKHGYSSVFDISTTDNNFSIAKYLCKYFYKDVDNRLFGHKKIMKSNNLKKPVIHKFNFDGLVKSSIMIDELENIESVKNYDHVQIIKVKRDK